MNNTWGKDTICVKGGYRGEKGEAVALPIIQSTSYRFDDAEHVANLFDLKEVGHLYTRISNPTIEALEKKFTLLEKGVGSVAVSSGQSATLLAVLNLCQSGDNIIALSNVYGGTFNLLGITLKRLGIEARFIDKDENQENINKKIDKNTKLIFAESISNPSVDVLDFDKFAKIAKENEIPFLVDNTIATPYLLNPFDFGANIVIHSTSKYADGHSVALGGIIVDGGNFNWNNGKFSSLVEPDESYHGIKYTESFKESAYIVKLRVTLLRDLGTTMSPFNAFLTNLGLETLHLRIDRHSTNALELAKFLNKSEKIAWVKYPLLKENDLCKKYLKKGASGLLSFGIKGGKEAAKNLIEILKLSELVVHLGDVRTTVLHPASTTHRQLSSEDLAKCGIGEELIRVSVGIENINDIINDFQNALNKIEV